MIDVKIALSAYDTAYEAAHAPGSETPHRVAHKAGIEAALATTTATAGERTWHRDGALLYTLKPHVNQFGRSRGKMVNDVTVRVEGPEAEARAAEIHALLAASPTPTDAQPKAARPEGDEALKPGLELALKLCERARDGGYLANARDCCREVQKALDAIHHAHPTTRQETVATPRDGGVRQALEEIQRRTSLLMTQNTGRWSRKIEHDRRTMYVLGVNQEIARTALSAPGSAGPGEPTDDALEAACVAFHDGDPAEWCAWKSCQTMPRITRFREQMRQALRAATPSPAQEPGTGDTGEQWQTINLAPKHGRPILVGFQGQFDWVYFIANAFGKETWAQGYAKPTHFYPLPAPATSAETRCPEGQTKGGL